MNLSRKFALLVLIAAPVFAQDKPATVVAAPRKDAWWQNRHQKFLETTKAGDIQVAFLGDSITQGWEGAGKQAWDKTFAPLKAGNYGIGGDQTQHVLWRITEGKELDGITPKVAVLMIGTNNFGANKSEDVALGIEAIVQELRKQKPDIKVLVLGVFPRGAKNAAKDGKIAAGDLNPKSAEVNQIISKLDDGKNVFFLDIGKTFLGEDGSLSKEIMPDYLHLSPKGYELWAAAIEGKVKDLSK
jgi:lysophospholipase L1-like esterase